jgi:hypothetical protein
MEKHIFDMLTILESCLDSIETPQFGLIVFTSVPEISASNGDFVDEETCKLIL